MRRMMKRRTVKKMRHLWVKKNLRLIPSQGLVTTLSTMVTQTYFRQDSDLIGDAKVETGCSTPLGNLL